MAVNVYVKAEDTGNIEKDLERAIRKFNKQMTNEGVLEAYKEKERFEKPSTKRHRKEVYQKHLQKFIEHDEIIDRK